MKNRRDNINSASNNNYNINNTSNYNNQFSIWRKWTNNKSSMGTRTI